MSNSAITLQCPSCGGIFLTLQQSSGPMEICPHCAVSSPRNLFLPAQGEPQPRNRTTLPSRRATGEPPRHIHPDAENLDTNSRGIAPAASSMPSQGIGHTFPPPATVPQAWEPAPQLAPQSHGIPGTASFAAHPAPPSFAPSAPSYGQPVQQIAPPVEPAPTITPPPAQLPELHFPVVAWDTPPAQQTPPSPAQAPVGWHNAPPPAPAAAQGFAPAPAASPFPAPSPPGPPTAPLGPTPVMAPPASPLQLPPPPQFVAEQQAPVYPGPAADFGSAPPPTSISHFSPASAPEIAPAPPPPFTPAPVVPQGSGVPHIVPGGAPSAPNTVAGTNHPSGWGPPASPVATPQWSPPAAIQPNQAPPANTPLAFFGIPAPEEPAEAAPEPVTSPAEQLPAVQPAPFSWPPQQPAPGVHQAAVGNSLGWAPGAPPIVHATQQFAHHPLPPAEPVNHPPPMWPGLGLEGSDQRHHPFANLFGRDASPPVDQVVPGSGVENGAVPPPTAKRTSPVLVILLLAIIGGTFWYVWKNRAKLLKLAPASQAETIIPLPSLEFAPAASPDPAPAATLEPSIDPLDAATPDITHNIAAADRAAVLMKTLDAASTEEDRLKVIFHAQDHKADVKRFFDSLGNQLKPILLDPTPAVVSPLLTGPKLRLFRLVTATCAKGAILRMEAGPNDTQLLDWPLFMQTHEQHFDKFVKSNPAPEQRKAEWFSVLCKRRHDFDLPKDSQDAYICLEAQGSLSAEGSTVLYVNKGLPAGRLLETHLKWAEIYLVDLLVGKAEIGGNTTHVVLDCTGTDTARK